MLVDSNAISNDAQAAFPVSTRTSNQLKRKKFISKGNVAECDFYLALALAFQINNTHINNWPQIGERFHHLHI
jgi:hypothetical protein